MMMTDPNDDMLDDLFAEARQVAPPVSSALIGRVMADAAAARKPARTVRPGFAVRLSEMLGGWPALGGLALATVAGLWVGMAPPAPVADLTSELMGQTVSVSLFADGDLLNGELFADG